MAKIINEKKLKFEIPEGKKKERIDTFLTNSIEHSTRSKVQKLIKAGLVLVNDNPIKANYQVTPGDLIVVCIPVFPRPEETEPEDIPLNIIYEDDYLIIINKPPGMVVHPALGNYQGTLVNALLHYTGNLSKLNEGLRPGIVHRLDKNTSGLLAVAKDEWTHAQLAKQFADRTITREYWAVCWGLFDKPEGEVIGNITRSNKDRKIFSVSNTEGKHAQTLYKVIEEYEFTSLVKLHLKTGRTHQIRVHMSYINHPVFGDPTYGGRKIISGSSIPKIKSKVNNLLEIMPRQALHAKTLEFIHPHSKKKIFLDSPLPADFLNLLDKLKNN